MAAAAGRARQAQSCRGAGIDAQSGSPLEARGPGLAPLPVNQLAAIAGPVQLARGPARALRALRPLMRPDCVDGPAGTQGPEGCLAAVAVMGVQLCRQQRVERLRVGRDQRDMGGEHGLSVDQHGPHQPFDGPEQTQAPRMGTVVAQDDLQAAQRQHGIHPPRHVHRQVAEGQGDAGALGLVLDVALDAVRPITPGEPPDLARVQVLQRVVLARGIGQRVVAPGAELIQPAVPGPGPSGASLRDHRAEIGVGQHVHPGMPGR